MPAKAKALVQKPPAPIRKPAKAPTPAAKLRVVGGRTPEAEAPKAGELKGPEAAPRPSEVTAARGGPARGRLAGQLQRTVGNLRAGGMLAGAPRPGPAETPGPEEAKAASKPIGGGVAGMGPEGIARHATPPVAREGATAGAARGLAADLPAAGTPAGKPAAEMTAAAAPAMRAAPPEAEAARPGATAGATPLVGGAEPKAEAMPEAAGETAALETPAPTLPVGDTRTETAKPEEPTKVPAAEAEAKPAEAAEEAKEAEGEKPGEAAKAPEVETEAKPVEAAEEAEEAKAEKPEEPAKAPAAKTEAEPAEAAEEAKEAEGETEKAEKKETEEAQGEAKEETKSAKREAEHAGKEAAGPGKPRAAAEAAPAEAPAPATALGAEAAGGETAAAGPAGPGPEAAGGGGAPGAPAAEGGEPQGGSEEEGTAELEERLAKADPERAAADEADPADVATGEPVEAEGEEPVEATAEPELPEPTLGETPTASETTGSETAGAEAMGGEMASPAMAEAGGAGGLGETAAETAGEVPAEAAPETEEEPSAEGFSGDEPALGAGAIQGSEAPDLSEPEKKVALESIGESAGGGGAVGGGGGGGGAVPDKPTPEVPDVSSEEPGSALAKVGGLPPAQLKQALGGVNAAVLKSAGDKRSELAGSPPQMERPTGSPKNLHGQKPAEAATGGEGPAKVEQAAEGKDQPTPEPKPLPEPPPSPAEQVREPAVTGTEGGELSERDVERMSGSIHNLPTGDPGLKATAGTAPQVELTGSADPAQTDEQRQKLQASVTDTQAQGRRDVAREMGENTKIFPSVAPETLTAKVPEGGGGGGGAPAAGAAAGGGADQEALSIIAQEEKGGEIQAAVAKAQGDMAAKKEEYATKVTDEKAKSAVEVAALEAQSTADQAQARSEAKAEVKAKKGQWSEEQEKAVGEANKESDSEVTKGRAEVQKQKRDADRQAGEEIRKGDEEAERERRKAEQKAAEEKRKGKKESSGFFGWLASKAKAFFNKIKSAIKAVFELARKAIKAAIKLAKKAAMWAIEQARKAIVATIKVVGKALIAIGDQVLADFPALRNKFRKAIKGAVDKAVNKVDEYAKKLKEGVSALLDLLAAGLDKLIGWLEKGMLAMVDAYAAAVEGAIKFAEKVAQAIGAFVSLIKDVAANPIQWIKNLGAAVVDGIKNHLWKAFKTAVQNWFNSKLEQVLGLGKMVWNLIKSGGLSLAQVGKMAWEGIKAMIPPTLIRILVEKLVAMIVPAAGAVMAIIEGLQAAWGTVSRIIAAFQAFFSFLKAVRAGGAGPLFANALAAAAIAVIDFVANWLIAKLAKGAAKIGGKIKGLAKKILGRKKGQAKGRKAKAKAKKPKKDPKPKKPAKALKRKKPSMKGKDKRADRKKEKERKKRERLAKAKRELPPKIGSLLTKGTKGVVLKARLLMWRARYRLSALRISGAGKSFQIIARVNPTASLGHGVRMDRDELLKFVRDVAEELLSRKDVGRQADEIVASRETRTTASGSKIETVKVPKGSSIPAQVAADRKLPPLRKGKHREVTHEQGGTSVRQVQSHRAEGREHQVIQEVSAEGKLLSPKKYVEIAKEAGTSGPALAAAMRTFNRTGKAPRGFDAGQLAALQKLMFSQEALRSPAALLQTQMSLDLLAKGKSPQDIFGRDPKRGGLFPMSAKGAQARAKSVDQALDRRPEGETPARVSRKEKERQMRREVRLIRAWVKSLDIKFKPGASQRDKIEKIKREIRQRMMAAFGFD